MPEVLDYASRPVRRRRVLQMFEVAIIYLALAIFSGAASWGVYDAAAVLMLSYFFALTGIVLALFDSAPRARTLRRWMLGPLIPTYLLTIAGWSECRHNDRLWFGLLQITVHEYNPEPCNAWQRVRHAIFPELNAWRR